MYQRGRSRHRGSNGRRAGGRNDRQTKARGLFANSIWHCNCNPRLPAEHFKVKKEGPNTGRWFYTCQKDQDKRCDFFLWDEDAKPREEAAVLNNTRTEPEQTEIHVRDEWDTRKSCRTSREHDQGKGLFAGARKQTTGDDEASTQSPTPPPSGNTARYTKRVRSGVDQNVNDEDNFLASDDDSVAEWAIIGNGDTYTTPRKAQKTGVYATPATTGKRKLPWLEQPTTPEITGLHQKGGEDYFTTPSKVHGDKSGRPFLQKGLPGTPTGAGTSATAGRTPSPPTRYKDALSHPEDSTNSLTYEVMACLDSATTNLPAETLANLRSILTKHDLKTQGITKGRDVSRLAIRAKDAKIAELQARIGSLEAEREVERSVSRLRKWEREASRQA